MAAIAAAAAGITLAPGAASAQEPTPSPEPAPATEAADPQAAEATVPTTLVRLKVGRQPVRRVQTSRSFPVYLVRSEGVEVGRGDLVRLLRDGRRVPHGPRRKLRDGDAVQVIRVRTGVTERRERFRQRTITRAVDHLAPGERRVVRPGRAGIRVVRIKRTFHNGVKVDTDIRRQQVRSPRPRRVLVGKRWGSVPGADGLNWRALANCESSGNPRAVNPAGYYGLYQFDAGTWHSVGGSGLAHRASAEEQTYRAKLLYKKRGRSPWPHCGRLL
ncbi:resuscitation-promoting factor [Nocardioides ferulae]|uniref:resuscitation-promoting factor n=1 Tax=Nocardioides ferulae TaxID=2340821 RepID=UPI001F0B915E|nr:transglycosylase family protein [Nocardioides ferulae]